MRTWSWLTPPAPAAVALLRMTPHPAALAGSLPAVGRVGLRGLQTAAGEVVDEVMVTVAADHYALATHGGPGVRAAVEDALVSHGFTAEADRGGDRLSMQPSALSPSLRWAGLAVAPCPAVRDWWLAVGASCEADQALVDPPFDRRWLTQRPCVLIAGPPNAGKSTLLNTWCGRARARSSRVARGRPATCWLPRASTVDGSLSSSIAPGYAIPQIRLSVLDKRWSSARANGPMSSCGLRHRQLNGVATEMALVSATTLALEMSMSAMAHSQATSWSGKGR